MRKALLFSTLSLVLVASTGCQSCLQRFCAFENAKNEALFGWLRGPSVQQQVCCEPVGEEMFYGGGETVYDGEMIYDGAMTSSAPCCGQGSGSSGILPGPVVGQ